MANPESPLPKNINRDTLKEIRDNTDWRELFRYLGMERDRKSTDRDWWAISPLNPGEKHASFHMNDRGWTCFSTHEGGYVIELVQKVVGQRTGRAMNCYEAGRWLLENGLSRVSGSGSGGGVREGFTGNAVSGTASESSTKDGEEDGKDPEDADGEEEKRENQPIRQTLLPSLTGHPEFERRGISEETRGYLGCGHLPDSSKSPLAGRLVFQVRGIREDEGNPGSLKPVILTHMGRALTEEQEEEDGKWWLYSGFQKTLELYNIDKAMLDGEAVRQAREAGYVIVTEGCFDVAKLAEAGIRNAVATFGSHLAEEQVRRLKQVAVKTGVQEFLFWYDRDKAGNTGQEKALETLEAEEELTARAFDWDMTFLSPSRGDVRIPEDIGDVCEFSVEQLRWLREKEVI